MKRFLTILFLFPLLTYGQFGVVLPPLAYTHVYSLVTDHTQCGSGNSTNFTVCVKQTLPSLKLQSNGGNVINTVTFNGQIVPADVVFSTTSDCNTLMNWDIESYNSTTGDLVAWVLVTTLNSSTDVTFYIGVGRSDITTYKGGSIGSAWNSGFAAVWHLQNGSTLSALEATTNANNGTMTGATATTGNIDGCAAFSGTTQYISSGNTGFPTGAGARTSSGWINSTNYTHENTIIFYGTSGSTGKMTSLRVNGLFVKWEGWGADMSYSVTLTTDTWYYVAATYDGTNGRIYVNGVLVAGPTSLSWNTTLTGTSYIAHNTFDSNDLTGKVDEPRVSSVARNADWFLSEYNNQKSLSTFLTTTLIY